MFRFTFSRLFLFVFLFADTDLDGLCARSVRRIHINCLQVVKKKKKFKFPMITLLMARWQQIFNEIENENNCTLCVCECVRVFFII